MDDHGTTGGPVGWECSLGVLDVRGTDDEAITVLASPEPYGWMDDLSLPADIGSSKHP